MAEAIGNGQRQQQRFPADGGKSGQINQIVLRQQPQIAEDAQHQHPQRRQPAGQIIPDCPAAAQRRQHGTNGQRDRDDDHGDIQQAIAQRGRKQRIKGGKHRCQRHRHPGHLAEIDETLGQFVFFDQREEKRRARHHDQAQQQIMGAHRCRPGQKREDVEDGAGPHQQIGQAAGQPHDIPALEAGAQPGEQEHVVNKC